MLNYENRNCKYNLTNENRRLTASMLNYENRNCKYAITANMLKIETAEYA